MDFESSLQRLWDREGRKASIDSGGIPNKFGVNQGTLDDWRDAHRQPRGPVADLTEEEARQIAYEWYWLQFHVDRLPSGLNFMVFQAVYEHRSKAIRWLQQILKVAQDGVVGPQTLAAIDGYPGGPNALLDAFSKFQAAHYELRNQEEVAKGSYTYPLKGLLNRVAESLQIARGSIGVMSGFLLCGLTLFF